MATVTGRGALLAATLCLVVATEFAECARSMSRTSGAVIGKEIGVVAAESHIVRLCGDHPDEICALPGLNGIPHVRMRAGYVTVSEVSDRRLWYLVADREQPEGAAGGTSGPGRRPEPGSDAAPVILWLTGGPGCSSLDAFIYEHGPFKFSYGAGYEAAAEEAEEAEEQQQQQRGEGAEAGGEARARSQQQQQQQQQRRRPVLLEANPYSWTKVATMIYVDSPAGAGMSYSGRPDVDYHTNDEYTIADLVAFLEGLTAKYPELASSPFFLAGESYGGVFVPLLARELLRVNKRRQAGGKEPLVDLRGYAVGNPVTDDVIDGNAQMFFAADMGYVDPPSWRRMRAACDDMFWNATRDSECWDAQGVVKDDLWDLNWYDVLDACAKPDDDDDVMAARQGQQKQKQQQQRQRRQPAELAQRFFWPFTARMGAPEEEVREAAQRQQLLQLEGGRRGGVRLWGPRLRHVVPCMDRRIALDWLNREEVRTALRAAPFSVVPDWQPCSDELYYRLDTMDLVPVHEDLVRQGLRAMVYTGDHDMVVPHTGTRKWLYDKADLGSTDGPLRVWLFHDQVAGFTARFSAGAGLRFVTVKGAGHMVPQSKPPVALHLLRAFVYDEEL